MNTNSIKPANKTALHRSRTGSKSAWPLIATVPLKRHSPPSIYKPLLFVEQYMGSHQILI